MAPKAAKFSDGERILCFHGPLMYEAKCIKGELRENGKSFYYLIHYNGWNKHWDEWVPESRVLKYNDANLQRQKDLLKQHGKDRTKRGKPSKPVKNDIGKEGPERPKRVDTPVSMNEPKKKKSKVDPSVEPEDSYMSKVEVNVKMPDDLKPILVDDWDLVMRQKQLFKLPAKVTIEDILQSYLEKNTGSAEKNSALRELSAGIKEYFNVMLGSQLLYRFERPQYGEIMEQHPDQTMSQIYGMPHLLRFFVRIGSILSYTNLGEKSMGILVGHMHKFLDYLQENISLLFNINEYEAPAAEYHRKVNT